LFWTKSKYTAGGVPVRWNEGHATTYVTAKAAVATAHMDVQWRAMGKFGDGGGGGFL